LLLDVCHGAIIPALGQEQCNFSFPAFDQTRQDFAAALGPSPESLRSTFPIASVGLHADGAALKVA